MIASERPAPVFIDSPPRLPMTSFRDAEAAVDRLIEIYARNTAFLRSSFEAVVQGAIPEGRIRAYYPLIMSAPTRACPRASSAAPASMRPPFRVPNCSGPIWWTSCR